MDRRPPMDVSRADAWNRMPGPTTIRLAPEMAAAEALFAAQAEMALAGRAKL